MIEEDPYSVPCFYPSSYIASRYKSLEKMMTGRDCVWKNKTKQNKKTRIYRRRVYMRGVSRFCVSSSSPHCCDENGLSIKIERDYPHPLLILGTIASNVKKKDKKKRASSTLRMIHWLDLCDVPSVPLFFSISPLHPFVLYNFYVYTSRDGGGILILSIFQLKQGNIHSKLHASSIGRMTHRKADW